MREYETMFVVQPEISDEGAAAILGKLDGELDRHGSARLLCEDWGRRKLAYEIDKFQKGHYRILRYLDEGQVVPDLERQLRLEESVLRFLTIVVDSDVKDVEARKALAAEEEAEQARRAAERAERDADEARQREEADRYKAEQEAAAAEAAAAREAADKAESEAAEAAAAAEEPA
ncbi:MAG: 30S ribosomal protein S6, partial [Myxococcota bacterium]|nr:30S ribosomal protein S6 [Myxococcota bacterium]